MNQFIAGGTEATAHPLLRFITLRKTPGGETITQEMLETFSIPPDKVAVVRFTVGEEELWWSDLRFALDQGVMITSSMVGTAPEIEDTWATISLRAWWPRQFRQPPFSVGLKGSQMGTRVNVNACMLFVMLIGIQLCCPTSPLF